MFNGDPDLKLVGAHAENAANTHTMQTHDSAFMPFPLMPHVLSKNLSPQAALTILMAQMEAQGLQASCESSKDFLVPQPPLAAMRRHMIQSPCSPPLARSPTPWQW